MGEIANAMINGDFDFYTGEYIGRGHGFPRTRNGSLPWEKNSNKGRQSAGVLKFLEKKGIKKTEDVVAILQEYVIHCGWDIKGKKFIRKVSVKIQEDWTGFAMWAGNKIANDKKSNS